MMGRETSAPVVPLKAARRGRQELEFLPAALEIIETPPSPVGRAIGAGIVGFSLLALAWSWFGSIDIIATAEGRVVPAGRTKMIQPLETGVVRAILVRDGMAVKAGDILIEIDPTASDADARRLGHDLAQDRLDIARLAALLADDPAAFAPPPGVAGELAETARRQMEAQRAEHQARLSTLERQIAQKEAERGSMAATIAKGEALLPLLKDQRDMRETLMAKGFGTKVLYLDAQQKVVEQEQQLLVDAHRAEEAAAALGALEKQRLEAASEYRKSLLSDLAKAQMQAVEHGEEKVKAARRRLDQTLTAPVDGTVQQLAVHTIGGVVTPAQQLMVIVPRDGRLEIEAELMNRDVGFVHAGQEAEVKVEAFTYTRYGLLHGVVESVSRDAVTGGPAPRPGEAAADETARQARQPTYVARLSVREMGLETEQGFRPLEAGMSVTAEIKTGRRRILDFLLSPLLRYAHEGGKER
ncbi:HlyD family type I secretion periplasmic adaptor subunit [Xanthobacter agilis]|uniref:Membrane fusion protein (MFP) family protein n=3 Tax=Xanthobacter agilis TaxID=47492 RepID=A0ABU0LBQ8_XANAG|nr:HlyD family type I secretion periplasmic adaptor subunit [Xanthobacter agilis]MDQ0504580.1 hemolysin D [Xanthobacter agilis]